MPIKLIVTSKTNKRVSKATIWIKVINLAPTIKGLSVVKQEKPDDPMFIKINAI
jgi:hypothetical protein